MIDSFQVVWHRRPGLFLAVRYLRRHRVPVVATPLTELPRLSPGTIRFALQLFPRFLDRADLTFPIIVAGQGWYQVALDGRHRLSKAIWTGQPALYTVRVPWRFALELLIPGPYLAEWVYLFLRDELRRAGHWHLSRHRLPTTSLGSTVEPAPRERPAGHAKEPPSSQN